jgi:phage terminase Nu1 subunit (DNA packaging protein)
MTEITTAVLARLVGLSERSVRDLARGQIFVRAGRNTFDQEASVKAYCASLRRAATGKRGDGKAFAAVTDHRARLLRIQADRAQFAMDVEAGKYWLKDETERFVCGRLAALSGVVLGLPNWLANKVPDIDPLVVIAIRDRLHEFMKDIAEKGPNVGER